ncbi:enoyl-CoA hydratase/isomerase family protein [Luteibacter aegosomaticola]|uniref:enoyl-CoA hydratase/isomerase family protein n=1 Tax=Luteibacter aegosomaticola TaxID=2911538 RepID=UPI001FFAD4DB|nr:enoyl-CoA hydratase/isomerase family protein [Luteibacter aegosomaticola]UPG90541.1 enoyl-CoA hydratase/isomerase family protein [Luteibacter aegosomaticola]
MNAPASDVPNEAPVLFEERAAGAHRIGIATLNATRTLNGLSLEMARLLDEQLVTWASDPAIALVVLQGAGEKAFCAGGDLHSLHKAMQAYREAGHTDIRENAYVSEFFAVEYRLDYRIHTYAKPIVCWGHGVVMGGGMGLMAGASHRVVTERSKLAFPEITVGLYPDVGGSWLLHRVPLHAGLFLALTGAPLTAGDAIYANMADLHIASDQRDAVLAALTDSAWSADPARNASVVTDVLTRFATPAAPGPLQAHQASIATVASQPAFDDVVAGILAMDNDDPWLVTARETLRAGAPGSARLAFELQRCAADMSLADVFRQEYIVSLHCAAHGDFMEGIRALLIDKDRQPHWQPATLADASATWADAFFQSPWPPAQHPLAGLGVPPVSGVIPA